MSATHAMVNLKPDNVIENLLDEFEHLTIKDVQLKANKNALAVGGKLGRKVENLMTIREIPPNLIMLELQQEGSYLKELPF